MYKIYIYGDVYNRYIYIVGSYPLSSVYLLKLTVFVLP